MIDQPEGEPEKKKIIIDEDWKSQVEAEKEELERKQKEQQKEAAESAAEAAPRGPLPPPTLEVLASSLAMQAMIGMGLMPNPMGGKSEVDLDQAKHLIDTVAMLEEKTEGNRTPEETQTLENLLHELRMTYLSVQQKQASS